MKNPNSRENCRFVLVVQCINCKEWSCYCCHKDSIRDRVLRELKCVYSEDNMCFDCRGMNRRAPLKKIKFLPECEMDLDRGKPYNNNNAV